jgi:penicillin amidase
MLKPSFCPSWRFLTDMGTDEFESVLPGGPSGNPWSGLYTSEMDNFLNFRYKHINLKYPVKIAERSEL